MKKRGFTLLELLFVIGLIALVGGMGAGVYSRVKQNEDMTAVVMQAVHLLNTARSKSVTGEGDMVWKIRLETDKVRLEDETGMTREEYRLPEKYSLFGPVTELVFNRADGRVEMCETGCVFELKETEGTLSYQFKILFSGAVEY
jgi:prepilin-type N-terminal cleavage/methylation domain-containing protein